MDRPSGVDDRLSSIVPHLFDREYALAPEKNEVLQLGQRRGNPKARCAGFKVRESDLLTTTFILPASTYPGWHKHTRPIANPARMLVFNLFR